MDDIFEWCKKGNTLQVKLWLGHSHNNPNLSDSKKFTPLHWACLHGHEKLVEMLLLRGAGVNVVNMGMDTPLHLAAANNHDHIVAMLLEYKAPVNFPNEHGNTPLHYACFWNYPDVAMVLANHGAKVTVLNKYYKTPLDLARSKLKFLLLELAKQEGQDLIKYSYEKLTTPYILNTNSLLIDQCVNLEPLPLEFVKENRDGQHIYRTFWKNNDLIIKTLNIRKITPHVSHSFEEEFLSLKNLSHPNVYPLSGRSIHPKLALISLNMPNSKSLFEVLHVGSESLVFDSMKAAKFAYDIAKGIGWLNNTQKNIPLLYHNSHNIIIGPDSIARINLAGVTFSFQRHKIYYPAWISPEALIRDPNSINKESSDMWTFGILLWELATRQVPFSDLNPCAIGNKIALEFLRVKVPLGISSHWSKLIKLCMNEDPGKRPKFDMIIPILEKMTRE